MHNNHDSMKSNNEAFIFRIGRVISVCQFPVNILSESAYIIATTTTTTTILRLSGLCPGQLSWDGMRRNIHPLTHVLVIKHPLSDSSIYYDQYILLVQFACLTVFFHNLCPSFLWSTPLGLALSSSYSIHFFTQSLSSFRSTCPYHRNLFCCSSKIMSSNPSLFLNPLLGTLSFSLMPHIHLTILISASGSATWFSSLMGQVLLPCCILLHTQLLYNLPLTINDTSLLVSNGTNCLNLFYPIQILVSTAALASPSTLNMSPK